MKTISLALALASAFFTCGPHTRAHAADADRRGAIEVKGRAVKAVTTGPALLHGYSEFSGGAIFIAPLATGTDADCTTALANRANIPTTELVADRMANVLVGAGQVACLVTDTRGPFELLWHAFAVSNSETRLAAEGKR